MGKSTINGPFSMAMLNNQRVTVNIFITSDQRTNMSNRHFLRENAPPKTEKIHHRNPPRDRQSPPSRNLAVSERNPGVLPAQGCGGTIFFQLGDHQDET